MHSALSSFEISISRVRHVHALHASFGGMVTAAIDLSDILRSEVVLAMSALDYYVHELTRLGMLECLAGRRPATDAFNRFQLSAGAATALLASPHAAESIFENEIRGRHGYLTFQQPDKIADAVRLFSPVILWDAVGGVLGKTGKDAKAAISLIADRRNKIAHEADADPSYPGQRWPIDRSLVENMLITIETTVQAIHAVAA